MPLIGPYQATKSQRSFYIRNYRCRSVGDAVNREPYRHAVLYARPYPLNGLPNRLPCLKLIVVLKLLLRLVLVQLSIPGCYHYPSLKLFCCPQTAVRLVLV